MDTVIILYITYSINTLRTLTFSMSPIRASGQNAFSMIHEILM